MIGDSWGVPNYNLDYNVLPETHTQHILEKMGHKVFNYAINGGSMLETIDYARHGIKKEIDILPDYLAHKLAITDKRTGKRLSGPAPDYKGERIDWIVWFYSESIRDRLFDFMEPWVKLSEIHVLISNLAYRSFKDLKKLCGNPKIAVIGGQSPIDPMLYSYIKPDFKIVDWRSDLVGKKLPECHSFSKPNIVNNLYDNIEEKLKTLDIHHEIMKSMMNTDIFFDRCHPGPKPHKELSMLLDKVFRGEVAQTV